MNTATLNKWAWWQSALAAPDEIGKSIKAHPSDPEQGYYRTRRKGGQWEPVAIFYPEGSDELVAYRNGREVDPIDIWTWCLQHPISYEAYEKAVAGNGFDDEPQAPASIGHNSGDDDPFDALRVEFLGEKEQAEEFLKRPIETQADADKAGIWAKRLADIAKRADELHAVEKRPVLDEGKRIDDRWRDLKNDPKDMARKLKDHTAPFLSAKRREEEERARKAREEAERQRQEAMKAQDEDAKAAALKAAQDAERASETKNASAGRTGARVSIRVEKVGTVTDYNKAAAALVAMKHKDMLEMIDRLAQRAARSGMPFDGMEIKEEEKVV